MVAPYGERGLTGVSSRCGEVVVPAKISALEACTTLTARPLRSCCCHSSWSSRATKTPLTSLVSTGSSQEAPTLDTPARL